MIPLMLVGYALRIAAPHILRTSDIANTVWGNWEEHQQTSILNDLIREEHHQTSILESLVQEGYQQTLLLEGLQTSLGLVMSGTMLLSGLSVFSLIKINQISKNIRQLRGDITNLSTQVDRGFWDLKNFVQDRTDAVIDYQYKTNVSQAYQHYCKGMQDMQSALRLENVEHKNHLLYKSRTHFDHALIIYDSQALIKSQDGAEMLKQLEMTTIIESMQGMLWFLLQEPAEAVCAFKALYQKLDTKLKKIGEHVDEKTIDLILMDTQLIRNNDMKLLKSFFNS